MKMFSSSLLLGLAGMVLAQDPVTTVAPDPVMTTVDGNLVVAVGSGQDVVFNMGDDSISISELPVGLRGYTDATIGALGAGFNMGRAQGDAQGRNYANEAELRLNAAMSSQASVINAMGSTIGVLARNLSTAQSTTVATVANLQMALAAAQSQTVAMGAAARAEAVAASSTMADLLSAANRTVTAELSGIRSDYGPAGLTAANPINTCMAVKNKGQSGFYWVRPAGASAAVKVWCDERWGGGWLQVFHGQGWQYKTAWKANVQRRAFGGIPSPDASNATNALSKLADTFVNQYLGLRDNGPLKRVVFRFSSDCFGPGRYRVASMSGGFGMFMDANLKSYDDRKSGMGLLYDARAKFLYGSQPGKTFPSRWWGGLRSVFDTPHAPSHMLGWSDDMSMRPENTCMRWFQGHRGGSNANNWHCYNPRSGTSNGERCFSHGSSCICDGEGNHPQAQGVMIFAKLRVDYGFKDHPHTYRF